MTGGTDDTGAVVVTLVRSLFDAIEERDWDEVGTVLAERVTVDHTSLVGGSPRQLSREELLTAWRRSMHPGKRTFHLLGHCRVSADGDTATAGFGVYVVNVLVDELGGGMWEAWGRHTVTFHRTAAGWRASRFVFDKLHTRGDETVYAHTADPDGEARHAV